MDEKSPEVPVDVVSISPQIVKEIKEIRDTGPTRGPIGLGIQSQVNDPSRRAETTFQQDLTTAGQRHINLIWERTQSVIAIMVVAINMLVGAWQGVAPGSRNEYPIILSSSLFLVIGFYFSRTNHAAIGGIGRKATSTYEGR